MNSLTKYGCRKRQNLFLPRQTPWHKLVIRLASMSNLTSLSASGKNSGFPRVSMPTKRLHKRLDVAFYQTGYERPLSPQLRTKDFVSYFFKSPRCAIINLSPERNKNCLIIMGH